MIHKETIWKHEHIKTDFEVIFNMCDKGRANFLIDPLE